jgi:nitroreductase
MERTMRSHEVKRRPEYPVSEIFLNRWSPRAMSGEAIAENELMSLFEAAKWAPSSYNNQSWRFIYARRGTPAWDRFLGLLVEQNRQWAQRGAALIVMVSKNTMDRNGQPARTHTFDTGAAWENFAIQGSLQGLVVHGMEGFDYDRARRELAVPEGYTVEAMAVVGRPGRADDLPPALREREFPSPRKKLAEFVFEGTFRRL